MPPEGKKLLLLDYTSETNLGDLALQEGLIRLLRQHYPQATLGATVTFGANQDWRASPHFTRLLRHEDMTTSGSLRHTYYPISVAKTDPLRMELKNVVGALRGVSVLVLVALAGRHAEGFLSQRLAGTCRLIHEADLVIWKGKNFRGTRWLVEPYRVSSAS